MLASPSPPVPEYHQLLPPGGDPVNYSPPFPAPSYSHHHLQQQQHHQLPPDYNSPEVEYKPHPLIQQQQQQQQQDPLSVEHYRSQFIKEGLKLKVQQKLKEEPTIRDSIDGEPDIKPETEVWRFFLFFSRLLSLSCVFFLSSHILSLSMLFFLSCSSLFFSLSSPVLLSFSYLLLFFSLLSFFQKLSLSSLILSYLFFYLSLFFLLICFFFPSSFFKKNIPFCYPPLLFSRLFLFLLSFIFLSSLSFLFQPFFFYLLSFFSPNFPFSYFPLFPNQCLWRGCPFF